MKNKRTMKTTNLEEKHFIDTSRGQKKTGARKWTGAAWIGVMKRRPGLEG